MNAPGKGKSKIHSFVKFERTLDYNKTRKGCHLLLLWDQIPVGETVAVHTLVNWVTP